MTPWESTYQQVCRELQEVQLLQTTQALLEWDQQTYLPQQGGAYRAEQVSFLAGEVHRRKSDPRLREKLQNLAHAPEIGRAHV